MSVAAPLRFLLLAVVFFVFTRLSMAAEEWGGLPLLAPPASLVAEAGCHVAADGRHYPYRQAVIGRELRGAYTLVLFLHSMGERGDDNEQHLAYGYSPMVDYCRRNRIKAVLLFPQCPAWRQWSSIRLPEVDPPLADDPTPAAAAAMELICCKREEFRPQRTVAVGISMGGYGVWDLLIRYPGFFSAGMAICGGGDVRRAAVLKDTPIFVAHGTDDRLVPVERSRSMVGAIWAAGGQRVVYREYPFERHDVWKRVFAEEETWRWLFQPGGRRPSGRWLPVPVVLPGQRGLFEPRWRSFVPPFLRKP